MILGSHLSIAGGPHRAVERAEALGFDALAMFVRNQVQWQAPPLRESAVEQFRCARARAGLKVVVAHASYLLNLAGSLEIRAKSIDALAEDLHRCQRLGVEYLVFHPGSNADVRRGLDLIAAGIGRALEQSGAETVRLLVETTAGQGDTLGRSFEQVAELLDLASRPEQTGVCLDTAHIFAAGYDLRTPSAWKKTFAEFCSSGLLERLCAIHCNDSQKPLGSHVDRHAHIGQGEIGRRGFRQLLREKALREIPLILETPKGTDDAGRDFDAVNAEVLRELAKPPRSKPRKQAAKRGTRRAKPSTAATRKRRDTT
jgi:deoxyribonuclease-4